jgi:hypothetical protein
LLCHYCTTEVPLLSISGEARRAVAVRLAQSRPNSAADELVAIHQLSHEDAKSVIGHLKSCPFSWPFSSEHKEILKHIDLAFRGVARPEHFTDFVHCEECKDHDDTLSAWTVRRIDREAFGQSGWSPLHFMTGEAWAYYLPAMARF